jgi:Protein of unknown function (DUF742)
MGEVWYEDDADPVVRPYTLTRGRTRSTRTDLNMISMLVAFGGEPDPPLPPEHSAIFETCRQPRSIAEVSALVKLPIGVVKVLVGDLVERGLVLSRSPISHTTDTALLHLLLDGMNRL